MWERIFCIVRKEFNQVLRHPRMRTMLFVPPLIQLIVFGYAVNMDVDNITMAWSDLDHTPASRQLLADFQASGRFLLVALPENEIEMRNLLDRGDAQVVIRVLPRFASDIVRGRDAKVQVMVDGSNSNSASLISSYCSQIVGAFSARMTAAQRRAQSVANPGPSPLAMADARLTASPRVWFNPDLVSRNYFVPGVVANIIMIVTVMMTAMAIVREKEIGTMEQLMVTPIRPVELMVGKMLPFALVGLIDMVIVTAGALFIFHVPFRGNWMMLVSSVILFLLTSLGAGLFISTISQTQQQAIMSSFLFATPTFMLSGFAFPIHNMPLLVQYITYLNPLRYFLEIVRGIFLKGTGVTVLWPQLAMLAIYGIAVMGLSAITFRKRLD